MNLGVGEPYIFTYAGWKMKLETIRMRKLTRYGYNLSWPWEHRGVYLSLPNLPCASLHSVHVLGSHSSPYRGRQSLSQWCCRSAGLQLCPCQSWLAHWTSQSDLGLDSLFHPLCPRKLLLSQRCPSAGSWSKTCAGSSLTITRKSRWRDTVRE